MVYLISIVIPVFNCEKYLAECIDSCLEQTYEDKEIIIVNDGSTDNSKKIAESYWDENDNIKVVNKKNGGTASALNEGIKCMNGSWFKWLSADDQFNYPDALKDMMNVIGITPQHKDYIFYTDYKITDENGNFIQDFDEPDRKLTRDLRNVELMNNFYGNASSSLIHKSMIDRIGLFKSLPFGEDLEWWLRACIKHKYTLYHLPFYSIQYRTHPDSLTSTKSYNENLAQVQLLKNEYYQFLSEEQRVHLKKLETARPLRRRILRRLPDGIRNPIVSVYRGLKK